MEPKPIGKHLGRHYGKQIAEAQIAMVFTINEGKGNIEIVANKDATDEELNYAASNLLMLMEQAAKDPNEPPAGKLLSIFAEGMRQNPEKKFQVGG